MHEFPLSSFLEIKNLNKIKYKKYWKLKFSPKKNSLKKIVKISKKLLINSVKLRLRSDVPIAFALSGGIDSNSIVSIVSKKFKKKIKTYSIIDLDSNYNEIENINKTIKKFNCKNKKIVIKNKKKYFK